MRELGDQVRRDCFDEPLLVWRELHEVRCVTPEYEPARRFRVPVQLGDRRRRRTSTSPRFPSRGLVADDRVRAVEVLAPR